MNKKTRKIKVQDKNYVYVINQKYHQGVSEINLSVSLKGQKNVTCSFQFCTWDDPISGSPLLVGVHLKKRASDDIEGFNLNYPGVVKQFIMYGLENGWSGSNRITFSDGLEILENMGYDVLWLKIGPNLQ
ncbi:hypothetical protein HQN87_24635 [Paenibacillus tritici]|uniref:Uncharacterized protein n=2 Tax=Paenibacillus tritici TaxID=1873425 RepID=A0ABX2DUZ3_9BACL|nr:hypothetical protein [Paenibacillus tritici]NQX48522.1 hypothetical protein [Paenibacillus tritici]